MSHASKQYYSEESYKEALDSFQEVIVAVIYSLASYPTDTKHLILRNTLARCSMSLKAIFRLWEISDFQDAWTLHRTLLERLFHLNDLHTKDAYEIFEDWSFLEQYKAQNRVKCDPLFKHEATEPFYKLSSTQLERAKKLSASPPMWKRPKAEDVAKSLELGFLYRYGYDFASMHVHPMANDGEQDFFTITKLQPSPNFPDQKSVLSNSLLAGSLILQEVLNQSSFKWRRILWDYIDGLRNFLGSGTNEYMELFVKVMLVGKEKGLCEPNAKQTVPERQKYDR